MSSETTPAYLAAPPDGPSDARDWLKAQLSRGVPEYPDPLRVWLDALPWRLKAVVVLSFVDYMTQEEIGYRLCITSRTVYSDLQQVYILVEGAGK
jgi:DNA-directed RNA polymerase specialized sigma24 family protein